MNAVEATCIGASSKGTQGVKGDLQISNLWNHDMTGMRLVWIRTSNLFFYGINFFASLPCMSRHYRYHCQRSILPSYPSEWRDNHWTPPILQAARRLPQPSLRPASGTPGETDSGCAASTTRSACKGDTSRVRFMQTRKFLWVTKSNRGKPDRLDWNRTRKATIFRRGTNALGQI